MDARLPRSACRPAGPPEIQGGFAQFIRYVGSDGSGTMDTLCALARTRRPRRAGQRPDLFDQPGQFSARPADRLARNPLYRRGRLQRTARNRTAGASGQAKNRPFSSHSALSAMRKTDRPAHGAIRKKRRKAVLGLQRLPRLQRRYCYLTDRSMPRNPPCPSLFAHPCVRIPAGESRCSVRKIGKVVRASGYSKNFRSGCLVIR